MTWTSALERRLKARPNMLQAAMVAGHAATTAPGRTAPIFHNVILGRAHCGHPGTGHPMECRVVQGEPPGGPEHLAAVG